MPSNPWLMAPSLHVAASGEERCIPGHRYGPAVRDYYLLHAVESGKGVLHNDYGAFPVSAGQAFLIVPGETTLYQADQRQPWHYAWAGFAGEGVEAAFAAMGLGSRAPVIDLGAQGPTVLRVLRELYEEAITLRDGELAAAGGVYRLLAVLGECASAGARSATQPEQYYRKALWLMEAGGVDVQDVADRIGLSRSQLFRVFKQVCGRSPKAVLDRKRMEQAVRLLGQTDLPLEAVAAAAGYSSAVRLCDVFRRAGLATPSALRRRSRGRGLE